MKSPSNLRFSFLFSLWIGLVLGALLINWHDAGWRGAVRPAWDYLIALSAVYVAHRLVVKS